MSHKLLQMVTVLAIVLLCTPLTAQNSDTAIKNNDTPDIGKSTLYEDHTKVSLQNSGIVVSQHPEEIAFKSHLRDYPHIKVELADPKGKVIYEDLNKIVKDVEYTIPMNDMPKGRYILRFIYDQSLVVCNVQFGEAP